MRMTCAACALAAVAMLVGKPLGPAAAGRAPAPDGVDLVVAQDGSGDYRTVQQAVDAVPADNAALKVILVRNGLYAEKVSITRSHLAIVGEDRDRTRIVFAELRKEWRASHPDDWGAATVNIGDEVTDLVLANLTIHNDYGARRGDNDHQFAIRAGRNATRIVLLRDRVVADGGDTLSLWNVTTGMYYHAECDFEGWVDYVCPRGWCYITNSRFFGHNLSASIWHDGSGDRTQKLVIRQSRFDGVPGFPLGRHHRDAQFYLLDAAFAAAMADRPIYRASTATTNQWGERAYYWNAHREGGDFAWFRDNLGEADGSPDERDVTAAWTFGGRWDPENTMPAVLPSAAVPRPRDGALVDPGPGLTLRWIGGRAARAHDLSFGPSEQPPLAARGIGTTAASGVLAPSTTYYWRVDARTPAGIVPGPTWRFTTRARPAPRAPQAGATSTAAARPASQPVRIVLVGDSTVTDDLGWGRGFKARLVDAATCDNRARNGRSSRSFIAEGLWKAALEAPADYVLIQFGHNDQPGKGPERETDPKTTYREFIGRYVDEARAARMAPILVTPVTRRLFDANGRIASDLGPYVDAMTAVAAEKKVPLVDLHAKSIELFDRLGPQASSGLNPLTEQNTYDRTHLSENGSMAFGGIVAEELARLVPALAPYLAPTTVSWSACLRQPAAWYGGSEAAAVADAVLLHQRATGGWPKNEDMARRLKPDERARLEAAKADTDSTIDNGATLTQVRFLALVHEANRQARYRAAAEAGIDYLLRAQYPNGGWPQCFPLREDYSRHVTLNDGAMVGVMTLLGQVVDGRPPYAWVDAGRRAKARDAAARGLALILSLQLRAPDGRRTGWAAQYDEATLAPAWARKYEPPSIDTRETVTTVEYLMTLARPGPGVVAAVDAAVAWLKATEVTGIRVESVPDPAAPRGWDRTVKADPTGPAVWSRFRALDTGKPMFLGRDSVVHDTLAEIEAERRTGYSWYGTWPSELLVNEYPRWKAGLR
jgi:PelA/Pel-15E family pectate lyase